MLMLKRKLIGVGIFWLLAAATAAALTTPQSAPKPDPPASPPGGARPADPQEGPGQRRLQAANAFLAAARNAYTEGTITIDRYISASQRLARAEAGPVRAGARRAAWQAHVDRMRDVVKVEQERFRAGAGSAANLAEASLGLAEAEDDLAGMP